MTRMFLNLRIERTPAKTRISAERFPIFKINFKQLHGEPKESDIWSMVHKAQFSALGYTVALTAKTDDYIKIGSSDLASAAAAGASSSAARSRAGTTTTVGARPYTPDAISTRGYTSPTVVRIRWIPFLHHPLVVLNTACFLSAS